MRVVAGSARGRTLYSPAGTRIRPTADRVKEAVFSSLVSRYGSFEGLKVLDLFAGSGSLGIEALSRGAARAVFTDSHPESISLTRKNLKLTGFEESADVLLLDAAKALIQLSEAAELFDIIFADPPYADRIIAEKIIKLIAEHQLTSESALLVFETDSGYDLQHPPNLRVCSRKVYGDTSVWMFERSDLT